jgi:hypothetical protein
MSPGNSIWPAEDPLELPLEKGLDFKDEPVLVIGNVGLPAVGGERDV